MRKKLGKDWRISGLLPFQASVSRKITDWFNVSGNVSYNGFSGGFQEILGTEKLPRKENYSQVKFGLAANFHLLKVINLSLEGGLASFRNLAIKNAFGENIASFSPETAPYFGMSFRYIASKSSVSSKLLGKIGAF